MMQHSEAEIIATLEGHGLPWRSFFVINRTLVAFHDERGRRMLLIIEDDQLNIAICKYLQRHGFEVNDDGEPD